MTNVPSTSVLSDEDRTAQLRAAGLLEASSGGASINRMTMKDGIFKIGDDVFVVQDAKQKQPAFIAQLVAPPQELQAFWFTESQAIKAGRPSIADKFCKSHFGVPAEDRKFAEDGFKCDDCPVNPFTKVAELPDWAEGKKCQWKGDLDLGIVERGEDGTLERTDETIYTITIPQTGMIEFKGTSREPVKGSVSERNFVQRLADLAIEKWGADQPILRMQDAFHKGAVVAEVWAKPAKNQTGSRTWHVIQFVPIAILDIEEAAAALPGPGEPAVVADDADDIPF